MPRLWRPHGRIGRREYLATVLPTSLVALALGWTAAQASPPLSWLLYGLLLPCAWTGICAQVKRLHDLGHPGWLVLGVFVPFLDMGIAAYSLLRPGQPHANAYGPPP